jgi:hypothetical protein
MTETGILKALPGALKANGPTDEGYRVFFSGLLFLSSSFSIPNIFSDAPRVYEYPHLYLLALSIDTGMRVYTWLIVIDLNLGHRNKQLYVILVTQCLVLLSVENKNARKL